MRKTRSMAKPRWLRRRAGRRGRWDGLKGVGRLYRSLTVTVPMGRRVFMPFGGGPPAMGHSLENAPWDGLKAAPRIYRSLTVTVPFGPCVFITFCRCDAAV